MINGMEEARGKLVMCVLFMGKESAELRKALYFRAMVNVVNM
jgi:hypothetical protein